MACVAHPEVPETRRCTACEARWCSTCVRPLRTSNRATCPTCGHLVVNAAPVLSWTAQIVDAVRRVRSVEGISTALAFAACFMLSRWMPVFVALYVAALVGYYFTIVEHVGGCETGLPGPSDAVDDLGQILEQIVRGFVCLLAGALPLLGYFIATHDLPSPALGVVLAALGQLYMPAALLSITLTNRALAGLWPVAWVAVIRRAPAHYARFAMLWLGSVTVGIGIALSTRWLVDGSLDLRETTTTPLASLGVGALVASVIWNLFWFAQAVLVGLFLRQHRDAFGWDDPS